MKGKIILTELKKDSFKKLPFTICHKLFSEIIQVDELKDNICVCSSSYGNLKIHIESIIDNKKKIEFKQ